jgi:hypothetical protein
MKRLLGIDLATTALSGLLLLAPLKEAIGQEDKAIKLFNGKDLAGFYTFLGSPAKGEKPYGKNNDPEKVFAVHDGMIHVSGKVVGALITEKEYENYHLFVEFKWGDKTWEPRADAARGSGILLHGVGADGLADGVWMESIQCRMIEGGTGDFILVKGKNTPKLTVESETRATGPGEKKKDEPYFKPGGTPREYQGTRINWFGHDPAWKDEKGFRGSQDVEKPSGQWNRLECICDGDKITLILNGTVVNVGTKSSHTKGKILFQSEGAELFFRTIELRPLDR